MTRVLLITDSERVQRVFQSLEGEGVLQLRSASTLALSDEELAAANPDFIFAQSRVSGFSSDLALRNLKKGLPPETRIVLLPVDDADLAQAKKKAKPFISLGLDDVALADGVRNMLMPEAPPAVEQQTKEEAPARKRATREKKSPAVAPAAEDIVDVAVPPPPETTGEVAGAIAAAPEPVKKVRKRNTQAEPAMPKGKAAPAERKRKSGEKPAPPAAAGAPEEAFPAEGGGAEPVPVEPLPFSGTPQWIAEESPADLPVPEPVRGAGDDLTIEAQMPEAEKPFDSFADIMRRAASIQEQAGEPVPPPAAPDPLTPVEPTRQSDQSDQSDQQEPEEMDEALFSAKELPLAEPETLSNGLHGTERRTPPWIIPVVLVLLFIPIAYFAARLVRHAKPPSPTPAQVPAPVPPPKPVPAAPAPAGAAAKQAPQAAKPAPPAAKPAPQVAPAPQPVKPAPNLKPALQPKPAPPAVPQALTARPAPARSAAVPPAQTTKPAAKAGLKALPPFMAGVPVDPAYARRHPGWQRYLGARGEYKIYKEGDVYRALQIIALPGQSIPDDIYQRALLEFAGIDSYRVQSSEKKGSFLVENGEATGGVGLVIYRKIKDLSLKGLVIYYH